MKLCHSSVITSFLCQWLLLHEWQQEVVSNYLINLNTKMAFQKQPFSWMMSDSTEIQEAWRITVTRTCCLLPKHAQVAPRTWQAEETWPTPLPFWDNVPPWCASRRKHLIFLTAELNLSLKFEYANMHRFKSIVLPETYCFSDLISIYFF